MMEAGLGHASCSGAPGRAAAARRLHGACAQKPTCSVRVARRGCLTEGSGCARSLPLDPFVHSLGSGAAQGGTASVTVPSWASARGVSTACVGRLAGLAAGRPIARFNSNGSRVGSSTGAGVGGSTAPEFTAHSSSRGEVQPSPLGGGVLGEDSIVASVVVSRSDSTAGSDEAGVPGSARGPARAGMQLRGRRRLRSERSKAFGEGPTIAHAGASAAATSSPGPGPGPDVTASLASADEAGPAVALEMSATQADAPAGAAAASAPTESRQLGTEPRTAEEWCEQVMALAAEQQRLQACGQQQQQQHGVRPREEWLAAFMRGSLLQAPLGVKEPTALQASRRNAGVAAQPSTTSAGTAARRRVSSAAPGGGAQGVAAPGTGPVPLRLLVGAMAAVDALYPRGEWQQLDLGCGATQASGQAKAAVGASVTASTAVASQLQQQSRRTNDESYAAAPLEGGQGQQRLQAQWLQAWWRATAEAARHGQLAGGDAAASAGRHGVAGPAAEAEAARDLELLQLLQYVSSNQPELRAQTSTTGADGGWLGGSWRSGRALRRQARAPGPDGADGAGNQAPSSRSGVAAAAPAPGWRSQPPYWWRTAVAEAVEARLVGSTSGGPDSSRRSEGGSGDRGGNKSGAARQQAQGGRQPTAGAAESQAALTPTLLGARVALLRVYAGTGLWARRRGPAVQEQKQLRSRVNPAHAVLQLVLEEWAAQQDLAAPKRQSPLSSSGLAALLRSQQLLGAPLAPAAAAAAVQMLGARAGSSQPVPLAVISDILAGVSTCPRPLPLPAAAALAAAAERSLLAARQGAAGPEHKRQDGPALLEAVKSLSRLWARHHQQLQREQGLPQAEHRGAPGQGTAVNPYEAALDACLPQLRQWLDSCSAAELLVASRSLITALRMRPPAGRLSAAAGVENARSEDNDNAGEEEGADDDDDGRAPPYSSGTWLGAGLGAAGGSRQRRAASAASPAPPAPAVSAVWAAFEAASAPLLDGVLSGGLLLQLAVDVSFVQPKAAVSPLYKMQLLRALTSAMEQSARRLAGMRGAGGRGGSAAEQRRGEHDPALSQRPARQEQEASDGSRQGSGAMGGGGQSAYMRPHPPRKVPVVPAAGVPDKPRAESSLARGRGDPTATSASSAAQLLSPDQVAHAAAAAARLLSQDRFVPAAVARRMQAAVLVAAQAMQPRELCLALAALGELQLTGLTPTGSELLLKVLAARLRGLPPASLPLLLWSLARMRLRPPSQWLAEYSRVVQQHVALYDMRQVAQLVWSYGQLVPQAPYSKMYFRPPRSLVRALLRRCLAAFGGLESRARRLRRGRARVSPQALPRTQAGQAPRRPRQPAPRPTAGHYSELRPADCALVVAGLAGLEARPDSRWLQGLYRWSGPLLASFRAADLGMLLYGLARLEAAPLPAWMRRAARCAELHLFHATGLDTAYTAYGLARLRPEVVSPRLLTALEVFVPLQLQNGAQEALRVGGVQAQQEVEAAWANFLRSAHRELREAVASLAPERGGALRRTGAGGDRGGVRLCRLDTGKRVQMVWPWRQR